MKSISMSHQYQESDINSLFLVKLSLFHFQNKADDDGHNTLLHIMQVISVVSWVSCHESWPFVLEFLPNRPPIPTMNKKRQHSALLWGHYTKHARWRCSFIDKQRHLATLQIVLIAFPCDTSVRSNFLTICFCFNFSLKLPIETVKHTKHLGKTTTYHSGFHSRIPLKHTKTWLAKNDIPFL